MYCDRECSRRCVKRRETWIEKREVHGMYRRMLRDDGNRMANVRRDHKVKVKRQDKLGESFGRFAPATGKQNIGKRRRAGGGGVEEIKRK